MTIHWNCASLTNRGADEVPNSYIHGFLNPQSWDRAPTTFWYPMPILIICTHVTTGTAQNQACCFFFQPWVFLSLGISQPFFSHVTGGRTLLQHFPPENWLINRELRNPRFGPGNPGFWENPYVFFQTPDETVMDP